MQFYFHESKRSMCHSTGDVRRHIFQGFENLKVEVHQQTNAVIESMVSCYIKCILFDNDNQFSYFFGKIKILNYRVEVFYQAINQK